MSANGEKATIAHGNADAVPGARNEFGWNFFDASGQRQMAIQGPGHRKFGNPGPLYVPRILQHVEKRL